MLQQTQVETVIPYFNRFISRFPDIASLASAEEAEVLLYWSGLGYYSRARNLLKAAQMIANNGIFPLSAAEWMKLPGIGRYTAGAILSIAGNVPEPVLDANVLRLFSRMRTRNHWGTGNAAAWRLAKRVVIQSEKIGIMPGTVNQALMEIGALICKPIQPTCLSCPLKPFCLAYKTGRVNEFPLKKSKTFIPVHETVYCVCDSEGSILLTKQEGKWRKGLYDFPDSLPPAQSDLTYTHEYSVDYTVTHHKVKRVVKVYTGKKIDFSQLSQDYFLLRKADFHKPGVPTGAALKKCLKVLL